MISVKCPQCVSTLGVKVSLQLLQEETQPKDSKKNHSPWQVDDTIIKDMIDRNYKRGLVEREEERLRSENNYRSATMQYQLGRLSEEAFIRAYLERWCSASMDDVTKEYKSTEENVLCALVGNDQSNEKLKKDKFKLLHWIFVHDLTSLKRCFQIEARQKKTAEILHDIRLLQDVYQTSNPECSCYYSLKHVVFQMELTNRDETENVCLLSSADLQGKGNAGILMRCLPDLFNV